MSLFPTDFHLHDLPYECSIVSTASPFLKATAFTGCGAADGCQAVGRGVQPSQPTQEGGHLHDGRHGAGGQAGQTTLPRGALHRSVPVPNT